MADTAEIVIGVDTHADTHTAAVLDHLGRVLEVLEVPTTPAGYRKLTRAARRHGELRRAGVEGTGAYGAGLARHLLNEGVEVIEVDRPNRQRRRRTGKSDPRDAEAAARAVLAGDATGLAKTRNGIVEAIRALHVVRRSAIKARTQTTNQIRDLALTAPEPIRHELRSLTTTQRARRVATWRPGPDPTPAHATRRALKHLGNRWIALTQEIHTLDRDLNELVKQAAPRLLTQLGVGTDTAAKLIITAGDNPHRIHTQAAFAALCGASPIDASSGKQQRHRLNRGGNRQANNALHTIALTRTRLDPTTRAYITKRQTQGKTNREITRCLKRYIARQLHPIILNDLTHLT